MSAWNKTRVIQITVGAALDGIGHKAWAVQEFRDCDCPDCDKAGHWMSAGHSGWYRTKVGAEDVAKAWGKYQT